MAETFALMKTTAIVLEPVASGSVPAGAIYNDSGNSGTFTNKSVTGDVVPVGASSSTSVMVKMKKNATGTTIAAYKRVALLSSGTICLADSDDPAATRDIGLTLDAIDHNAFGRVLLNGANADGALVGLGFVSGQDIFLSKTPGGLTNNVSAFDPNTDTIMRVGTADCANNDASSTATDLLMTIEVYSRPGGG
jgi:hypothetical protein